LVRYGIHAPKVARKQKQNKKRQPKNMKSGRSIMEFAREIERQANAKSDYVAKTSALSMSLEDQETDSEFDRLLKLNVGTEKFGINSIAHSQIGEFCGIPSRYYDRCRTENPDLLIHNVNTWIAAAEGQKRMVRTLDGNARAFLSDAYRPLENVDLAQAILPVILDTKLYDIMSCQVTDTRLYIKVVGKALSRKLAETGNYLGDGQHKIVRVAYPAVTISNSEVGYGALSIQVGLYDSGCSNLATFGERSMRKTHLGARHGMLSDELVSALSEDTRRKTDAALWGQVRDVVAAGFDGARFNALVDQVEGSKADRIDREADVVKVVKAAGTKLGITETEQKGVLQALIEGADLSRFGLYNAITAYSQGVDSYDRATELERAGAAVIELPKNDWQQIAKAS
jgi:hypothetical protein